MGPYRSRFAYIKKGKSHVIQDRLYVPTDSKRPIEPENEFPTSQGGYHYFTLECKRGLGVWLRSLLQFRAGQSSYGWGIRYLAFEYVPPLHETVRFCNAAQHGRTADGYGTVLVVLALAGRPISNNRPFPPITKIYVKIKKRLQITGNTPSKHLHKEWAHFGMDGYNLQNYPNQNILIQITILRNMQTGSVFVYT